MPVTSCIDDSCSNLYLINEGRRKVPVYLLSNLIREAVIESELFKAPGPESQVAADGGCERDVVHRLNQEYRAWRALKSELNNRGLGINMKKCLYEGVIVPVALYGAEAWVREVLREGC